MLGGLFLTGALMAASAPLDTASLKTAMQEVKTAPADTLTGQAFRITIPFVNGRKRNMPTFQSPARWVYDYKTNRLDLIIGPGEVTSANYDQFAAQGLDKLPPLQSYVFDSREVTNETSFTVDNQTTARSRAVDGVGDGRGDGVQLGVRSWLYSFALAVPYDDEGLSGLPAGLKPLAIHKVEHLPEGELRRYVNGMTLVLEGETTDLGQKPPMFCGGFRGAVTSKFITGDTSIAFHAKQCFVTARITKVTVMRGGETLASWPHAPVAAD